MEIGQHKKQLLHKLREETISAEEYHQLEIYALDDPFLFESLEGYAFYHAKGNESKIVSLDKGTKKRTLPLRKLLLAVASCFILFFGASYFLNQGPESFKNTTILSAENTPQDQMQNEALSDSEQDKPTTRNQDKSKSLKKDVPVTNNVASDKTPPPAPIMEKKEVPNTRSWSNEERSVEMSTQAPEQIESEINLEPVEELIVAESEDDVSDTDESEIELSAQGAEYVVDGVKEEEVGEAKQLEQSTNDEATSDFDQAPMVLDEVTMVGGKDRLKQSKSTNVISSPEDYFDFYMKKTMESSFTRKEYKRLPESIHIQYTFESNELQIIAINGNMEEEVKKEVEEIFKKGREYLESKTGVQEYLFEKD